MSTRSDLSLQHVYELLRQAKPLEAKQELDRILPNNLGNKELLFIYSVANFWAIEMENIAYFSNEYEKGEHLIAKWKFFSERYEDKGPKYESLLFFTQQGVFQYCLTIYLDLLKESMPIDKAGIFARIGICYKKLGDYPLSLKYLKEANTIAPKRADILAQMADAYALCGEEIPSKALFREAFFINPKQIDMALLESELFCKLYKALLSEKKENIAVWIPVYGLLYGILTMKRELKSLEVGQLKQAIYTLEKDYKEAVTDKDEIKARLINHYFWLIDHYIATNENRNLIQEVLLKIKIIDSTIYEQYCA